MMFSVGFVAGAVFCVVAITVVALLLVCHEEWDEIDFDISF